MDESFAHALLERMGCHSIRTQGDHVNSSCPFLENHHRGDRHPSFSARISVDDRSPFVCFSCHEAGTLEGLAITNGHSDLVPDWRPKRLKDENWVKFPSTNIGMFGHLYRKDEAVFFEDKYLEPFLGVLSGYLRGRGITKETARAWQLGVDKDGERAIFVVRDVEGRLGVVVGRDVTGRSRVKYSFYSFDKRDERFCPFIDHDREDDFVTPTKKFFLYGEDKAWTVAQGESDRVSDDLIVVEGQVDVLKVWQYGWNVVGTSGSMVSVPQEEKLVTILPEGKRLVIMADDDEAGQRMAKKFGKRVGNRVPVYVARLTGKDPGEASEGEVRAAIESARLFGLTS